MACSFFIDTAHNIIQYLETIFHILKPGGYWINMGMNLGGSLLLGPQRKYIIFTWHQWRLRFFDEVIII